jgi:hypothetical protein
MYNESVDLEAQVMRRPAEPVHVRDPAFLVVCRGRVDGLVLHSYELESGYILRATCELLRSSDRAR